MIHKIRLCTPEDVPLLKALTRPWFDGDEYIDRNWRGLDVLVVDGTVVGYADCKDNCIDGMLIDFALHRKGYGSMLLQHCEQKLFVRYEELLLECFESSVQANYFYRKNGWREARRFFDAGNTGQRKVEYRKRRGGA